MLRVHSVIDCGKVVNLRLARSQVLGQQVWGIGATLSEASEVDARMGGIANRDLAEYFVPVCADIGDQQVEFLNQPDTVMGGGGAKGIG